MPVQTSYTLAPATTAVAGKLACRLDLAEIDTAFNDEASANMMPGRAVKWGSATDHLSAKLPAAETDKIRGIVMMLDSYESGTNGEWDPTVGTGGVKPDGKLNILRKGVIWVVAEDAVVPGDRLWVRAVAGGDPEFLGGLTNADDSTDTIDCTGQGTFLTAAAAGALAKLAVDFTNL